MSYSSASIALHGPTLTLRPPAADDAPALLELAADPDVTRWFSWGPYTRAAPPRAVLDHARERRKRGGQLALVVVTATTGPRASPACRSSPRATGAASSGR